MVDKKDENKEDEINEPNSEDLENKKEKDVFVDQDQEEESTEENKAQENTLVEEIETLKEEKIRLLAEMENLRKRFEREKVETIKFGSINLARDILSPGDNLARALEAIPEDEKTSEKFKNLIDGLNMVQKEFSTILRKHGVNKIEAINTKFDHNLHQAMVELEDDKVDEGTVVQEMQSGYTMHDRLLRPSMVAVSKKPAKKDNSKKND